MLTRKPMPLDTRFDKYNNNNLHEYDPYIITSNGELIIDKSWWDTCLSEYAKNKIKSKINKIHLGDVSVPHEVHTSDERLTIIYWTYLESFDYNLWYTDDISNGPKSVKLLKIDDETKKMFCAKKFAESAKTTQLTQNIREILHEKPQEYFVRLSGTSGKNEKTIRPFKNADDIVKHLQSLSIFRTREYERDKDTYIVMIPWNDKIDCRCEFRIFVVNKRITAASPQRFWDLHQYSSEELEAFEKAFEEAHKSFISDVPFATFVADVYVDVDSATCYLIELNPFGAHCGAGASFFNWIDDYNILYGVNQPGEFRYLSAINY